ncbi:MAG: VCBS repeat-containing protein [Lewinellaceae bacterium]|nr:VCBS repeat-containing protein [Lewinellaceae bacterium]
MLVGTPDVNNDGYPDIVIFHNFPSRIHVRLNNGSGGFGSAALYTVSNYCNGANVYDLDRDGDLDIVAFFGQHKPFVQCDQYFEEQWERDICRHDDPGHGGGGFVMPAHRHQWRRSV